MRSPRRQQARELGLGRAGGEEEKAEHGACAGGQGDMEAVCTRAEAKRGPRVGRPGVHPVPPCLSVPVVKPPLSLSDLTCDRRTPTVPTRGADPQKEDGAARDTVTVPAWRRRHGSL